MNIIKILQLILISLIIEKIILQNFYTCSFSYYFFFTFYILSLTICYLFPKNGRPNFVKYFLFLV